MIYQSSSSIPARTIDPLENLYKPKEEVVEEFPRPNYDFNSHFYYPKKDISQVQIVQEGGYMDITEEDLSKYYPEGLAGGAEEEFDFSQRTSWMVRDTTKVLCR
jgi:hypothetical protein